MRSCSTELESVREQDVADLGPGGQNKFHKSDRYRVHSGRAKNGPVTTNFYS
jgi:hypothetical protein